MEPTLKTGSVLLGIRIIGSIETGDIIVFRHNERLFVKRVAAVGGDMIEHDGQLVTVPVDCFCVLGDNTEHSYDSRYWVCPFVTLKDIVAKVCTE
jgi:signal peptidase I